LVVKEPDPATKATFIVQKVPPNDILLTVYTPATAPPISYNVIVVLPAIIPFIQPFELMDPFAEACTSNLFMEVAEVELVEKFPLVGEIPVPLYLQTKLLDP
jgi:hypothetical protein